MCVLSRTLQMQIESSRCAIKAKGPPVTLFYKTQLHWCVAPVTPNTLSLLIDMYFFNVVNIKAAGSQSHELDLCPPDVKCCWRQREVLSEELWWMKKIVYCGLSQSQSNDDVTFPLRALTIAAAALKLISCFIFPALCGASHLPSFMWMLHMFISPFFLLM